MALNEMLDERMPEATRKMKKSCERKDATGRGQRREKARGVRAMQR
jgi:hypothetical protein